MTAGHSFMPTSWEGLVALLGALGIGGVLTALAGRPSRRAVEATAAKDQASGEAAVITATATAFTEVTSGLREEIERLQRVAVTFEADLAAAHDRLVAHEAQIRKLTADLERVRRERDVALEKVEMLNGEVRQRDQLILSLKKRDEGATR